MDLLPGERIYPLLSELKPGDHVSWRRVQRGRYGFASTFIARVVRVGAKKVTIEINTLRGVWQASVYPESLRKVK